MNKVILSLPAFFVLIFMSLIPVFANQYDHLGDGTKVCGDHICTTAGEFQLRQKLMNDAQRQHNVHWDFKTIQRPYFEYSTVSPELSKLTRPNFSMDIHLPNGVNYMGIVLSYDDFQTLKTNIAIMAVINITPTTAPVSSITYCNLAESIWASQDSAFQAKYPKNLVVPDSCNTQPIPVPEFPTALLILCVTIFAGMVFTARSELIK